MKSSTLKLITYASTLEQVQSSLEAGANHLILEDSKLSLRPFHDDFATEDFTKITTLANHAKKLSPDCELSFNLDILPHNHHFPLIHQLAQELDKASITTVRVQDSGLAEWFKEHAPHITLILNCETGNQNTESIRYYQDHFKAQVLVNDIPNKDIQKIIQALPNAHFQLQVQGPILIQNSPRPFLSGLSNPHTHPTTVVRSQDHEYPGRYFTFYQNPHGHLMYAYFDKCLIKNIPELVALNLSGWIIDGRGYPDPYTSTCLKLYRALTNRYIQNPDTYEITSDEIKKLDEVATLPQKPGFFKINQTDQDRIKKSKAAHSETKVGIVVDSIKGEWISIQVTHPFSPQDTLAIMTPEGKRYPLLIEEMYSIWNQPLSTTDPISPQKNTLIKLKWQKGSQVKSALIKYSEIIETQSPITAGSKK
jgi:collagenase-like PrtC family protease